MKSYFVAIETGASVNVWDIKVIWSNFTFQQSKSYSNQSDAKSISQLKAHIVMFSSSKLRYSFE